MNFKDFFIKRKSPLTFGTLLPEIKKIIGVGGESIEGSYYSIGDELLSLVQDAIKEGALKDQNGNPISGGGGGPTPDFDTVVTTAPYTIDGTTYPSGTPLSTIATALINAEAANGEFRGVFSTLAVLNSGVTNPISGDLAFVTDTNGIGGGETDVSGFVQYNGSSWLVVKLFEKPAKLITDATLTAINPSHTPDQPLVLDVQNYVSSNNLKNVYISYIGSQGNFNDPMYLYYVDKDGFCTNVKKTVSVPQNVTQTVNGARFTYQVLSGTPTLTYDKSNPLTPTLTVSGGTIKLLCVKDTFSTSVNVNPVFTFNATWQDAMDARPVSVLKIVEGSDMLDVDNTPQVINNVNTTTQSVVTINAVDTNHTFIFTWVH